MGVGGGERERGERGGGGGREDDYFLTEDTITKLQMMHNLQLKLVEYGWSGDREGEREGGKERDRIERKIDGIDKARERW